MLLLALLSVTSAAVALPQVHRASHDVLSRPSALTENFVVFGDSYSDNCNTWRLSNDSRARSAKYPFPACPPSPIGRAGGGPAWPEFLQNLTNQNVVNYAHSAATCSNKLFPRTTPDYNMNVSIPDVGDQIDLFMANKHNFSPENTSFAIFIGTNDLTFFTGRFHPTTTTDVLPKGVILNDEVDCVLAKVARLRMLGYKKITVMENIPLEYTQLFSANKTQGYGYQLEQDGPFVADTMASLVGANNRLQREALIREYAGTSGVSLFPTHQLYQDEIDNPDSYGFTKPINTFCEICPGKLGSSGNCTACEDPLAHLFWDQLHPGEAANQVLADHMARFLKDPASL